MEDLLNRFRRGAQRRRGLRYSRELRELAVTYATQAHRLGQSWGRIAESLGVSGWSLARWLRVGGRLGRMERGEAQGAGLLCEVAVVESREESRIVLVLPSGVRVEGLGVRELMSVLGVLA